MHQERRSHGAHNMEGSYKRDMKMTKIPYERSVKRTLQRCGLRGLCRSLVPILSLPLVLPALVSGALAPRSVLADTRQPIYLGVSVHQWGAADLLQNLKQFQTDTGKNAAMVVYWRDFAHSGRVDPAVLTAIFAQGSVPVISWTPTCWGCSLAKQRAYTLQGIVQGRFDSYIRASAASLKSTHEPIFMRFAPSM